MIAIGLVTPHRVPSEQRGHCFINTDWCGRLWEMVMAEVLSAIIECI